MNGCSGAGMIPSEHLDQSGLKSPKPHQFFRTCLMPIRKASIKHMDAMAAFLSVLLNVKR